MRLPLPTFSEVRRLREVGNQRWANFRYISRNATLCNAATKSGTPADAQRTFEDLGLHPPILAALRAAFPNVRYPTEAQQKFIPAILRGQDVLLKDVTGSGKTLGLVVALLNKARLRSKSGEHITSLLLVPHRDLAYQSMDWIRRMYNTAPVGELTPHFDSVAQVLVRDGKSHLTTGLARVREIAPHILIGTPQAVLDVWRVAPEVLQFGNLSSLVVDEVDYLVETVARKDPRRSFRGSLDRANKKLQAHPGVTREILDIIYADRKRMNESRQDEPGVVQLRRKQAAHALPGPQLIMSSATLRRHLSNYLFEESGWLNRDNLLKVKGGGTSVDVEDMSGLGGSGTTHSVLVVSEDGIRNIAGAVPIQENKEGDLLTPDYIFSEPVAAKPLLDTRLTEKYGKTPSPFNPNAMEAIATTFALDVKSAALLVLAPSAPVQRAVYEMKEMGVNARGLDITDGSGEVSGEPSMVVCTAATLRGLDLGLVTHVFVMGILGSRGVNGVSVDGYVHIAGRVGRFGREGGKVISVVCTEEEEKTIGRILSERLGVQVVKLGLFD